VMMRMSSSFSGHNLIFVSCTLSSRIFVLAIVDLLHHWVKIIYDCYIKILELIVDDTVIMFMIPLNGKIKTEQLLVIQKKKKQDVHRATIEVTSQYNKIVNT